MAHKAASAQVLHPFQVVEDRVDMVPPHHCEPPHGHEQPRAYEAPYRSSECARAACCHCAGTGSAAAASNAPAAASQEQIPPGQLAREAPRAAFPLQNPERQSMVSTLERAVADLERDVMARSGQPTEASSPSFAHSLDSLAALEAEITAQQRRLARVGVVPKAALDQMSTRPASVQPSPRQACVECNTQNERQREVSADVESRGIQDSRPLEQGGAHTCLGGTQGSLTQRRHDLPTHTLAPEELSFSHTAYSTIESEKTCATEPLRDRAASSSPDGNFSMVSIEDRLKRLGLSVSGLGLHACLFGCVQLFHVNWPSCLCVGRSSTACVCLSVGNLCCWAHVLASRLHVHPIHVFLQEQISQLIKDITADTESTSSPAQSPGESFPWLRALGNGSDTASTVTLPSLAPPKPLLAGHGLRSSSASPLDEFASSRSNGGGHPLVVALLPAGMCERSAWHEPAA